MLALSAAAAAAVVDEGLVNIAISAGVGGVEAVLRETPRWS